MRHKHQRRYLIGDVISNTSFTNHQRSQERQQYRRHCAAINLRKLTMRLPSKRLMVNMDTIPIGIPSCLCILQTIGIRPLLNVQKQSTFPPHTSVYHFFFLYFSVSISISKPITWFHGKIPSIYLSLPHFVCVCLKNRSLSVWARSIHFE